MRAFIFLLSFLLSAGLFSMETDLDSLVNDLVVHDSDGVRIKKNIVQNDYFSRLPTGGILYFDFDNVGWGDASAILSNQTYSKEHHYAVVVGDREISNEWFLMEENKAFHLKLFVRNLSH